MSASLPAPTDSPSTPWLADLNSAQREAVLHEDGPLLIVAGAGTGKTRTLVARVAHLIHRGVRPDRLLLLTFTRRAASEMLRRAEQFAGALTGGGASWSGAAPWGGTFHAVANRLLRMYGRAIGLPQDFSVIDQSDAADVMAMVRTELGVAKKDRRFPRKETLVSIYSRTVNAQERLESVLEKQFPWCRDDLEGIRTIFEQYLLRKRASRVMDYDDLLLAWKALMETDGAGAAVERLYDHVLVDEYQDTNIVQADILNGLRRTNRNLTVVGDDAQAIYSFRAATVRNILDFPEQFPGAKVVKLEENYRSTQRILDASNTVMSAASHRHAKTLYSSRRSDVRPMLLTCEDERQQTDLVCDHIITHLERGIPLRRQAVLFRAGHHSDMLEVELARRNIPFVKFGGLKFVEAAHIKDMMAFLRVLENPYDEISWHRLLLLLESVGPATAQRIIASLGVRTGSDEVRPPATPEPRSAGASPVEDSNAWTPLKRLFLAPPTVAAGARKEFEALRHALADCSSVRIVPAAGKDESASLSTTAPLPLAAQLERIRKLYEPLLARRYENPAPRLRDIEQLEQIARGYRSRENFISDLTLDPPTSTADLAGPPFLEDDWTTLSTIHSAKGCEWDIVHVLHAADGMIPSDMATRDEDGIEEERRLFYVALTRARDMLYVYFPLRYYHKHRGGLHDLHTYAQLTRFLTPQARECFHERSVAITGAGRGGPGHVSMQELDRRLGKLWG